MYWCHLFTSTVVRQSTTHLYLCTGAISLHPQSLDKVEFGFWFHEGWVSRCYPLFLSDIISSFSYMTFGKLLQGDKIQNKFDIEMSHKCRFRVFP